jgi:uncharacterized protein (DUF362 family)
MPSVAIVKGSSRYENIIQVLDLLGPEAICGINHVLKPNFVSTENQLASTHREAAQAVLDFLHKYSNRRVIIAEGAALHDTYDGFRNFGFNNLVNTYDGVELRDLNRDQYETFTLYDEDLNPQKVRIAKTVLESDHRISLSIPKTHDTAMVTLGLKNMVVGSLIRNMGHSLFNAVGSLADKCITCLPGAVKPFFSLQGLSRLGIAKISGSDKVKLHQGYLNMHLFLYQLIRIIPPHLTILDGFEAMEGDGPVTGTRVDWRVAIAGTDGIAVDVVAAHLMGFNPNSIGYLNFCGKAGLGETSINNINVIGTNLEECERTFRTHRSYTSQILWKERGASIFDKITSLLGDTNPA